MVMLCFILLWLYYHVLMIHVVHVFIHFMVANHVHNSWDVPYKRGTCPLNEAVQSSRGFHNRKCCTHSSGDVRYKKVHKPFKLSRANRSFLNQMSTWWPLLALECWILSFKSLQPVWFHLSVGTGSSNELQRLDTMTGRQDSKEPTNVTKQTWRYCPRQQCRLG